MNQNFENPRSTPFLTTSFPFFFQPMGCPPIIYDIGAIYRCYIGVEGDLRGLLWGYILGFKGLWLYRLLGHIRLFACIGYVCYIFILPVD